MVCRDVETHWITLALGREGDLTVMERYMVLTVGTVCRVPEAAGIHDKSYYTSNKDHLFYELQDISLHVLAHSQADLAHAASMYSASVCH